MMQRKRILAVLMAASTAAGFYLVTPVQAQPSADQVLTDMGLSADDKQKVLNGEFVTANVQTVSDRDLSIAIAFLVKTSPDDLAKQVMAGDFVGADSQVQAHGEFKGAGSIADLSGLQISADEAQKLTSVQAGSATNFSTSEIAAFNALQAGTSQAVQQQLQQMLLARFQAYKTTGLAGITPYDRGGSSSDVAADLSKASNAAAGLKKYMPGFQKVLAGYPQATLPGMHETFQWLKYNIDGTVTYVLTHRLIATDGPTRAVVQRQYYASTTYNAEQAVAGFLPVQGGTVAVYTNHTFTDQVAGFGGSMKRSIGSRMMGTKLKALFDKARTQAAQ